MKRIAPRWIAAPRSKANPYTPKVSVGFGTASGPFVAPGARRAEERRLPFHAVSAVPSQAVF